jgi:hypothetical protein
VVTAEQEKILGILDFVCEQKTDCFKRLKRSLSNSEQMGGANLLSSVNIVTHEEVVGLGREASILKQTKQIVVLTVDVTCKENVRHNRNPVFSYRKF